MISCNLMQMCIRLCAASNMVYYVTIFNRFSLQSASKRFINAIYFMCVLPGHIDHYVSVVYNIPCIYRLSIYRLQYITLEFNRNQLIPIAVGPSSHLGYTFGHEYELIVIVNLLLYCIVFQCYMYEYQWIFFAAIRIHKMNTCIGFR